MKTFLMVAATIIAFKGLAELVAAAIAKDFEREMRWQLRGISSWVLVLVLIVLATAYRGD